MPGRALRRTPRPRSAATRHRRTPARHPTGHARPRGPAGYRRGAELAAVCPYRVTMDELTSHIELLAHPRRRRPAWRRPGGEGALDTQDVADIRRQMLADLLQIVVGDVGQVAAVNRAPHDEMAHRLMRLAERHAAS